MDEQASGTVGKLPGTNELAIVSLVCGVAGILNPIPGFALGIVAIVLGIKARGAIRASDGTMSGSGLALTGLICGIVSVVGGFLYFCFLAAVMSFAFFPLLLRGGIPCCPF